MAMGQTSSAAQIIISVIPIVGIVMGSLVVFFYLLWSYKWKKLLIQAGQYRDSEFDLRSFSLLAGLLLGSVGITLTVFLAVIQGAGYALLGGLIPLSTGTGLLIFYGIKHGDRAS
jgi:hypothetical protein